MLRYISFLVVGSILFVSCQSGQNSLDEYMLGNWETSYIEIKMPTYQGSDSLHVYQDDFSTPDAVRAQSTYSEDGTFQAWYLKDGEKQGLTDGTWLIAGDSLQVFYSEAKPIYFIEQTPEGFHGYSVYDWDNDGLHDDTLVMHSVRIKLDE